jgi:hypothetical protein
MNFLISTIVRNRSSHLKGWHFQLQRTVASNPEHSFFLSVFENDSTDFSFDHLKSFDYSFFSGVQIVSEKLNTLFYPSVINAERVRLLALYRNKTLETSFLKNADYILSIEPDIKYDIQDTNRIINNHDYDILSAASIHLNGEFYDSWGTRVNSNLEKSILHLNGAIQPVWSTYNCYCKYKANLIKQGVGFSGFNKRLNKFDCDTAVICENFRSQGYNKIAVDTSVKVYHS